MGFGVWGLGFGVLGSGFWGLGSGVWGLGFGFRVGGWAGGGFAAVLGRSRPHPQDRPTQIRRNTNQSQSARHGLKAEGRRAWSSLDMLQMTHSIIGFRVRAFKFTGPARAICACCLFRLSPCGCLRVCLLVSALLYQCSSRSPVLGHQGSREWQRAPCRGCGGSRGCPPCGPKGDPKNRKDYKAHALNEGE